MNCCKPKPPLLRSEFYWSVLAAISFSAVQTTCGFVADTPITPEASPETRSLMAYFSSIYGKQIISGQQEYWQPKEHGSFEEKYLQEKTGKLPGLVGMDLSGYTSAWRDTNHVVAQHAIDLFNEQQVLVALCWHWRAPMDGPSFYTKETKFDITRAVTPGTPEHAAVLADIDLIADELTVLRDAHVPVLWRPLHEANGRWFWWGAHGPEPFQQLWQLMYEQLAIKRHLTNLIWVYSPGAETDLAAWYPGDAYVDIIGQDLYPMDGNHGVARDVFDELKTLGGQRKPVALAENGPVPDPAALVKEKAGWLFFTTWSGDILTKANTSGQLHALFNDPYVLNQGDLPDVRHFPFRALGKPVKLAFHTAPDPVAVNGVRYIPTTVAVEDAHGQTIREGSYTVSIRLKSDGDGKLSGALTAATINGIATFPDLSVDAPGNKYQLLATAADLKSAVSDKFTVGPGNGPVYEWWSPFVNFSNAPTGERRLTEAVILPVAGATNFAAKIHGCLVAPQTGDYHFWLANEGSSELWLSTDATPERVVKIAEVTGATPYCKWPHTHEAGSPAVKLIGGRSYYFEIRQRQSGGSTQLALRWRLPDGGEERPLPAWRIVADR
jgi:hypothetical protein